MALKTLRVDDLGASSKCYEQWSRTRWANVGPLKRWRPWKAWGPYREMSAAELDVLCGMVHRAGSRLTLAITAYWVERDGSLTPYAIKFPEQAVALRHWMQRGTVEIANHGMTHCRVGRHLPSIWRGNREAHREFVPEMTLGEASDHLRSSQARLSFDFGVTPRILIPPGFMFPAKFEEAVRQEGLRVWRKEEDADVLALHDRDFVLGDGWARVKAALGAARRCGMTLPEIRHLSREDAVIFVHPHPFIVISITDPFSPPADFVACAQRRAVLRLEFHDVDYLPDGYQNKDIVMFSPEHARRAIDFVETHRDVDLILIHCEAGLSRSAGLAAALAMRLLSRTYQPRKGIPNRRVYLETVRMEMR